MQNVGKTLIIGLFVVGLAGAVGYSAWNKKATEEAKSSVEQTKNNKVVLNGIITSEKESFLKDERVKKIFQDNNLEVNFERWTSDKIVTAQTVKDFGASGDFVFPSGVQASDKIKQTIKGAQAYNMFYSPMVIATWTPIVNILEANNLIKTGAQYKSLDMEKFFPLMSNKIKWKELKQSESYPVNKNVLIYTSDSRFSNSSKMFIALAGYVYNKSDVVTTDAQADAVIPKIKQLMDSQGSRESSSINLFMDYTSVGIGKAPLIFVYESQIAEYAIKNKGLNAEMAFIYPSPTLFTKHVLITFNEKSQRLVDLLSNNEELKKIAADYGFRFTGNNSLIEKAKSVGVNIPVSLVDVVDPPSFDVLEKIIQAVETK